jgi:hypothetical protein
MLKLVCSYSRKGPGDEEYSSRQYHAGLEMELPEGMTQGQLDAKVHETFGRLRDVVESELNGKAKPVTDQAPASSPTKGNGNGRKISNAQAKFALDLARKAGLKLVDIEQMVRDEYGANNLYELGAGPASSLIESLKARQAA